MLIKAEQKFIRISPRKIKLVADVVRNLDPLQAISRLRLIRKTAAQPLTKALNQALANAANSHSLNQASLRIKHIQINQGPTYKRWQPVSRGRAHSIYKRSSHILVILETVSPTVLPKTTPPNPTSSPVKAKTTSTRPVSAHPKNRKSTNQSSTIN